MRCNLYLFVFISHHPFFVAAFEIPNWTMPPVAVQAQLMVHLIAFLVAGTGNEQTTQTAVEMSKPPLSPRSAPKPLHDHFEDSPRNRATGENPDLRPFPDGKRSASPEIDLRRQCARMALPHCVASCASRICFTLTHKRTTFFEPSSQTDERDHKMR